VPALEHAFAVFTEGYDSWWPRTHHIGNARLLAVNGCRLRSTWRGPVRTPLVRDLPRENEPVWRVPHEHATQFAFSPVDRVAVAASAGTQFDDAFSMGAFRYGESAATRNRSPL